MWTHLETLKSDVAPIIRYRLTGAILSLQLLNVINFCFTFWRWKQKNQISINLKKFFFAGDQGKDGVENGITLAKTVGQHSYEIVTLWLA